MPDKIGKYRDKAVIEPARVIKERKQIGLHPSCPVPVGAIMCYDAAFWQWVREYPGNAECDGWLKGSYLVPYEDSRILVIKVPGFGAPTAVMTLEELIAFGIKKFVNIGAAGGLQQNMNIGDIVICDRAIRDEGTSFHYLPGEKFAYASPELTERLNTAFERKGIECSRGTSWTTDAPYRETNEELRQYRSEGVATVEMETSALLAVGAYREVCVSAVFAISDLLLEEGWNQGYHSEEKLDSLKKLFKVAIEILSKGDIRDAHYDDNREEVHPKSDLRNPFGVGGVS
jgi:uridine phosphorylase